MPRLTDARLVAAVTTALSHSSAPYKARTHAVVCLDRRYISVRAKSPARTRSLSEVLHAGRVFIKRVRRAYDVEGRVYLFPREQEEAADIYAVSSILSAAHGARVYERIEQLAEAAGRRQFGS